MLSMEFLDDEERTHLKLKHKQERDGRIRDRIKAVLLHDSGWSPQKIAEALLVGPEKVRAPRKKLHFLGNGMSFGLQGLLIA